MYGLKVVLADEDRAFIKYLKEKLLNSGHFVVGETSQGRKALQMVFNIQPDLVIMNAKLPGKDGIEVAKTLGEHRVAPVILIVEPEKKDDIGDILEDWSIPYILKPVDETNLFPAIEVCRYMFRKMCQLEEENRKLRQTLESRKLIDMAKGLIVKIKGLTEQQAFDYIQKISMDQSTSMKNVARKIIAMLEKEKPDPRNRIYIELDK